MIATASALVFLTAASACAQEDADVIELVRVTATPIPTPTPTPPAPKKPSECATPKRSRASIVKLIMCVFGRHGSAAVRVFGCESKLVPDVTNASGHRGIAQLSVRWHVGRAAKLGFTWEQMKKAKPNVLVAKDLFDEKGWQPWTCARIVGIA